MSEYQQRKANLGFVWIKSRKSGATYLLPAGAVSNKRDISDEELRKLGIDESQNPQND